MAEHTRTAQRRSCTFNHVLARALRPLHPPPERSNFRVTAYGRHRARSLIFAIFEHTRIGVPQLILQPRLDQGSLLVLKRLSFGVRGAVRVGSEFGNLEGRELEDVESCRQLMQAHVTSIRIRFHGQVAHSQAGCSVFLTACIRAAPLQFQGPRQASNGGLGVWLRWRSPPQTIDPRSDPVDG